MTKSSKQEVLSSLRQSHAGAVRQALAALTAVEDAARAARLALLDGRAPDAEALSRASEVVVLRAATVASLTQGVASCSELPA